MPNSECSATNKSRLAIQHTSCTPPYSLLLVLVTLLSTVGCRKADVERQAETLEPVLTAGDPAYLVRTKVSPTEPWYRDYQAVLDKKPESEKELDTVVAEKKSAVSAAVLTLLGEIRKAVESKHKDNDKWSLLSLNCGRPHRGADIQFTADVCLTKLFVPRPVIAFNNVPLDLGIAKLARETGIQDSVPRNYNPRVFWTKTNVSAYEAIDDILKQHGYSRRFSDTLYRVSLRLQDFKTKEAFMDAAIDGILAKAKDLNTARPSLIVSPLERTQEKIVTPENSDDKASNANNKTLPKNVEDSVRKDNDTNKETPPN